MLVAFFLIITNVLYKFILGYILNLEFGDILLNFTKKQMFSTGQINFAIFFIIAFSITIFLVYRKDLKQLKNQYKGIYWVLLLFLTFVGLLFLIKQFLMD